MSVRIDVLVVEIIVVGVCNTVMFNEPHFTVFSLLQCGSPREALSILND